MRRIAALFVLLAGLVFPAAPALAEQRFPPPDFESGYKFPTTTTPGPREAALQWADVALLAACLGFALWCMHRSRSRRHLFWLSVFSVAYFGFYRKGCICPIGSPQNVVYGLFHPGYAAPLGVLAFFALPLFTALVGGRAFCAGVCPHGALQDFFLIKPLKVPPWLEHGLGLLPFIFLGAGLAYAGTGVGFVICRYDPFVPIFRLSGSLMLLTAGAAFLGVAMFVGRPYCRFLCPYGAMLKTAAGVSKWRIRVTPDLCTQCRLCESSCPFGAMREPSNPSATPVKRDERRRLAAWLGLTPVLVATGALAGTLLAPAAAQLHPTIAMAELHLRQLKHPVAYARQSPEALALERVAQNPEGFLAAADALRPKFKLASGLFGGWAGLVIALKGVSLGIRPARKDFEPDRGACFGCARCFASCPNERTRLAGALGAGAASGGGAP
jgi:NosR/NirI family transcriptional regulator, nitrous oxide reductase regulator